MRRKAYMLKITIVAGPDTGLEFAPTGDTVTIGRGHDCDVVLHDSAVSRRHCTIERKGIAYIISDLRTANGIALNDPSKRITGVHALKSGDEIIFGRSRLRVELPALRRRQPVAAVEIVENAAETEGTEEQALSVQDAAVALPKNWDSAMTVIAQRPKIAPPPVPRATPQQTERSPHGMLARVIVWVKQLFGNRTGLAEKH